MWWILGLVAILAAFLALRRGAGIGRLVDRTLATGDPSDLVEHLSRQPETTRPTAFDQAVRNLWDRYERAMAARVVRAGAGLVAGASITQYWIRQILEVEPEVSRREFDDDFLETYYQPEVAARCGKMG